MSRDRFECEMFLVRQYTASRYRKNPNLGSQLGWLPFSHRQVPAIFFDSPSVPARGGNGLRLNRGYIVVLSPPQQKCQYFLHLRILRSRSQIGRFVSYDMYMKYSLVRIQTERVVLKEHPNIYWKSGHQI